MPVTINVPTVTGSSASFDVSASGSGFGIFSSYSAYASEALSFTGSTTTGVGSFSLSLDTSFGDLVFSGTDTIAASTGGYTFVGSETLSFVFGSDTLSYATGTLSAVGTTYAPLTADLDNFYSSITSINGSVTLADSVAAAAATDVASNVAQILNAAAPTVTGGSVSHNGVEFTFLKS